MAKQTVASLSEEMEALRQQLAALTAKLTAIEGAPASTAAATATAASEPELPPQPEEVGEEILLALSAAVAAYLGKRAHIKTVRLLGSTAWAQQGRVSIQASHRLNVQHHHHQ
jgi:methylmalonyl-CoA carboxyltransferase 12S subunit